MKTSSCSGCLKSCPFSSSEFVLNYFFKDASGMYAIARVALGKLMDSRKRHSFRPDLRYSPNEFGNLTGSVGFMDFVIRPCWVPPESYTGEEMFVREAAVDVLRISVEPVFLGRGYSKLLMRRAEEIAVEEKVGEVVVDMIKSERLKEHLGHRGYVLYHSGGNAVKRF